MSSVAKTRFKNETTEVINVINIPKHTKKNPTLNFGGLIVIFVCVSIIFIISYTEYITNTQVMRRKFENFSRKLTRWIGSPQSILVHTVFFVGMFFLRFEGFSSSDILLILTTIVSLEAIYLSIFIQMTVNRHAQELEEVSEDIEEIQENVEEIQEDVEEIQEEAKEITNP